MLAINPIALPEGQPNGILPFGQMARSLTNRIARVISAISLFMQPPARALDPGIPGDQPLRLVPIDIDGYDDAFTNATWEDAEWQ